MWPLRNEWLHNETSWAVLLGAPFEWGESTSLITKTTHVPLKCLLSFSWMTSQMNRGCAALLHFLAQLFPHRKSHSRFAASPVTLPCYTHQLFVTGVCADYLVVWSWPSFPRLHLAVKTILASSVAGVIFRSRPHGWETMRSLFTRTMPLSGPLSVRPLCWSPGPWHISSFLLRISFCLLLSLNPPPPFFFHLSFSFLLFFFFYPSPSSSQRSQSSLCSSIKRNTKSQPDGSSHKFQASVKFWLGKRKANMHVANTAPIAAHLRACWGRTENPAMGQQNWGGGSELLSYYKPFLGCYIKYRWSLLIFKPIAT